jgi:hypothetical protein
MNPRVTINTKEIGRHFCDQRLLAARRGRAVFPTYHVTQGHFVPSFSNDYWHCQFQRSGANETVNLLTSAGSETKNTTFGRTSLIRAARYTPRPSEN